MGLPVGNPVQNSSGSVAAAPAVATLPGTPNFKNFVTGFELTAGGATAAALVNATLAGIAGGTLNYTFAAPAGVAVGATPLTVYFDPPIPASAVNTAITLTLPSLGAGNTNATAVIHGFQLPST